MHKGNWNEFGDASENCSANNQFLDISSQEARVQRTRAGKGGKTVTIISGLNINDHQLKELLKKLKKQCGTGGTLKGQNIELQGDKVNESIFILEKEGFSPKQAGG